METNVLDWLEVTAAACPDKPAFLDEDSAVTFADVRREARIIGTAAAKFRAGQKRPIAVMSGRNAHTPAVFLGAVYAGCCYAPMDGTMPVHRLNSILNTLDTDLMIVQRAFYDKAKTLDFSGTILIAEELLAGSEDAALTDFFRTLGQLRRTRESLRSGALRYLLARGGALAIERERGGERTVTALNAGDAPADLTLAWDAPTAQDAMTGQRFLVIDGKAHLTLPPLNGVILV